MRSVLPGLVWGFPNELALERMRSRPEALPNVQRTKVQRPKP
jgi:hypothetical protein